MSATLVLDSSVFFVYELTVYCCFVFCCICCRFLFFCCRSLFLLQGKCAKKVVLHHMQQASALEFLDHHEMLLHNFNLWSFVHHRAHGSSSGWRFQKEVGELTSSWHKNMNCYRTTVVCLDAKRLWKPGQSFILTGFTLSLPRSAPCGTEQTTIDTGCDPALPRNCWSSNRLQPLQNFNLIKFTIIQPSTLNHDRNLWNFRGAPDETTCFAGFFSVS